MGHNKLLNFCSSDKELNFGLREEISPKKRLRFVENLLHLTRKWSSVSTGGVGGVQPTGVGGGVPYVHTL